MRIHTHTHAYTSNPNGIYFGSKKSSHLWLGLGSTEHFSRTALCQACGPLIPVSIPRNLAASDARCAIWWWVHGPVMGNGYWVTRWPTDHLATEFDDLRSFHLVMFDRKAFVYRRVQWTKMEGNTPIAYAGKSSIMSTMSDVPFLSSVPRGLQPRCDGTKHGDTCVGQCFAGYTGALWTPLGVPANRRFIK